MYYVVFSDPTDDNGFVVHPHYDMGTVGAELAVMSAMQRESVRVLYGTELVVTVKAQVHVAIGAAERTFSCDQSS